MKRNVTLVPWTDLLHHAVSIEYDWNQAHDILVKDEVPPMYEANVREYYLDETDENNCAFNWSKDSIKIVNGFMKENKLKEMTVTRD